MKKLVVAFMLLPFWAAAQGSGSHGIECSKLFITCVEEGHGSKGNGFSPTDGGCGSHGLVKEGGASSGGNLAIAHSGGREGNGFVDGDGTRGGRRLETEFVEDGGGVGTRGGRKKDRGQNSGGILMSLIEHEGHGAGNGRLLEEGSGVRGLAKNGGGASGTTGGYSIGQVC